MRSTALVSLAVCAALAVSGFACSSAGAEIFIVGAPLESGGWTPKTCEFAGCAFLNEYGRAPTVSTPPIWPNNLFNGVIVRLNVVGATTPGQLRVRTSRLEGTNVFERINVFETASAPVAVVPSAGIVTYPMAMPVAPGDQIALSMSAGTSIGVREGEGPGSVLRWNSDPPESGPSAADSRASGLVGFNVEIQPPPTIQSIGSFGGPTTGGTTVPVSGGNFAGVSAVTFGGVPAMSYTVESEGRISAVVPPRATPGPAPIAVTTVAGTATSPPGYFTYYGPARTPACVVPRLRGRTMTAVRRALGDAECELGTVKRLDGASAKTGRVLRQSVRPGRTLEFGAEISVTLKPRRPAKPAGKQQR